MTAVPYSTRAVVVIALLFAAAVINYIDRGSLSVAAPFLSRDLALTPVDLGFLLSSFFWTYAACQLGAGWLVDRFPVRWVFAAGFAIWSTATIATGFAHGFDQLFALRLLLGVGESVAFPCFARIVVGTFASDRRGLPNAVIDAGTKIGPAIGVFTGGMLSGAFGWRTMFVVLGAASLLWLVPWGIWGPRLNDAGAPVGAGRPATGPRFADIFACRDAWGTFIGTACYLYAYFFLLTWLPTYLVDVRGLSARAMGVLGALPYLAAAVAALGAGWLSDRWIQAGASPTRARKTMVVGGLLLSVVALPAAFVATVGEAVSLLTLAYVAFGIFASNLWAISQTLAGEAAGKWAGMQNCIGALTGIAAPIVTGYIVAGTGSYLLAFAIAAALAVVGAGSYLFIVGRVEPVDWAALRALRGRPVHAH